MPCRPRLLLLNGALAGNGGNTAAALAAARRRLVRHADVESLSLVEAFKDSPAGVTRGDPLPPAIVDALTRADGFLFGTGTHWDSWSSVLQHFLEAATPLEGTTTWLGKPAAVVVTEHSVGGKAVLSPAAGRAGHARLQPAAHERPRALARRPARHRAGLGGGPGFLEPR